MATPLPEEEVPTKSLPEEEVPATEEQEIPATSVHEETKPVPEEEVPAPEEQEIPATPIPEETKPVPEEEVPVSTPVPNQEPAATPSTQPFSATPDSKLDSKLDIDLLPTPPPAELGRHEQSLQTTGDCSSHSSASSVTRSRSEDQDKLTVHNNTLGGLSGYSGMNNTAILQRRKSTTVEFRMRSGRSQSISIEPIYEMKRDAGLTRMLDAAHQSAIRLRGSGTINMAKQNEQFILHSSDSMRGLHQSMNKITPAPVDEDDECPICLDTIINNEGLTTSCSHNYHYVCLLRFLRYKNVYNCPYCTQEIKLVLPCGGDEMTQEQLKDWFYSEASNIKYTDKCYFKNGGGVRKMIIKPEFVDGVQVAIAKLPELTFQLVDSKGRDSTFTEDFEVRLTASTTTSFIALEGGESIVDQMGFFTMPNLVVTVTDHTQFDYYTPVHLIFTVSCLVGRDDLGLLCDEKTLKARLLLAEPAPPPPPQQKKPAKPARKQVQQKPSGFFGCCTGAGKTKPK